MASMVRGWWLLPVLCTGLQAHAQIYICKDAAGRTLTSDRPIPECLGRGSRQLDSSGVVRREIAPPPTAEQRLEMQRKEEQRKAALQAADEQRNADRAMLARYQKESDIELGRKRAIESAISQIKLEREKLGEAADSAKKAEADAERFKARPAPPAPVQRRLELARQNLKDQQAVIAEREGEVARINARFDQTLRRFREVTGTGAAQ